MSRFALLLVAVVACGDDKSTNPNDDATNGNPDSPKPIDAPGTGTDASFQMGALCGATTCMTTQVCCTGAMIACKQAVDCPTQNFACDGPEDCGTGTCCFGSGGQGGSVCKAAGQNCQDLACHYDTDCSGATPKCCPKPFTPSYGVCQAAC
jgi:hypothetical protein